MISVIYFSGTGNSKYIAEKFASMMGCKAYSIEDDIDFTTVFASSDTIAVCYPIYGSCVPRNMRAFATGHRNDFSGKKLIIFCTQMIVSGDGAREFSRLLPECEVVYAEHFNMPNNLCNLPLLKISARERRRKVKAADAKLERVCSDIRRKVVKRRGWNFFSTLIGKSQRPAFLKREEKAKGSFRTDDDCILCGKCVHCCPVGNLSIKDGHVVQNDKCIICYRCVNLCPRKACTTNIHIKPKRQYGGPVEG